MVTNYESRFILIEGKRDISHTQRIKKDCQEYMDILIRKSLKSTRKRLKSLLILFDIIENNKYLMIPSIKAQHSNPQ